MDASGDATEQMIRITLMGTEYALKIAGEGAGRVGKLLMAIAQQTGRTKGKVRLATLLKREKPLQIFEIKQGDLEQFAKEAKKYSIMYAAIRNPEAGADSIVDIIVSQDDKARINRIIEKFDLAVIDTDAVIESIERDRAEQTEVPEGDIGVAEKTEVDRLEADFISAPIKKEVTKPEDPIKAQPEQTHPSEPTSKNRETSDGASAHDLTREREPASHRPSVRKDIEERAARRAEQPPKPKAPPAQTKHQQPTPNTKMPRAPKLPKAKER